MRENGGEFNSHYHQTPPWFIKKRILIYENYYIVSLLVRYSKHLNRNENKFICFCWLVVHVQTIQCKTVTWATSIQEWNWLCSAGLVCWLKGYEFLAIRSVFLLSEGDYSKNFFLLPFEHELQKKEVEFKWKPLEEAGSIEEFIIFRISLLYTTYLNGVLSQYKIHFHDSPLTLVRCMSSLKWTKWTEMDEIQNKLVALSYNILTFDG